MQNNVVHIHESLLLYIKGLFLANLTLNLCLN